MAGTTLNLQWASSVIIIFISTSWICLYTKHTQFIKCDDERKCIQMYEMKWNVFFRWRKRRCDWERLLRTSRNVSSVIRWQWFDNLVNGGPLKCARTVWITIQLILDRDSGVTSVQFPGGHERCITFSWTFCILHPQLIGTYFSKFWMGAQTPAAGGGGEGGGGGT